VSDIVFPKQIGELLPVAGEVGPGSTVTFVVDDGPVHPPTVTEAEYVPASAVATGKIVGSSSDEVKLFGPLQL
jgi:plastocyanin